ncbi:MAG: CRISPR-associated endoribonuclease Cas6 [Chloroflexi bacterium]|nr:CRISPR-associated endoribonuclease Cas6 [Chloroflexota bacterium]
METDYLRSIILDFIATNDSSVSVTTGHQAHALFLNLIEQADPALNKRLHNEPGYRPFTVSALMGVTSPEGNRLVLRQGCSYQLRVTLLDGGQLWHCITNRFLEGNVRLRLGKAELQLKSIVSNPSSDRTGWTSFTDWHSLATNKAYSSITLRFTSPTAFSLGHRHFVLFPQPVLIWESLIRVWNNYAPHSLRIEKENLQDFIQRNVNMSECNLSTATLHFPHYLQKGFVGTCTFAIDVQNDFASQLSALAKFARYSGVGYKTTMGMGQVCIERYKSR